MIVDKNVWINCLQTLE